MTVVELKRLLDKYLDDMEVITKKTEIPGNVGRINSVKEDSYWIFGLDIPCVVLSDEVESEEEK